jgi:hypothetical protein
MNKVLICRPASVVGTESLSLNCVDSIDNVGFGVFAWAADSTGLYYTQPVGIGTIVTKNFSDLLNRYLFDGGSLPSRLNQHGQMSQNFCGTKLVPLKANGYVETL